MSDQPFPNIRSKLHAPPKKSAFEKAKAEAEAKRLREEAETAAVYEDFVKSFSHDEPTSSHSHQYSSSRSGSGGFSRNRGAPPLPGGPGTGARRHFTGLPPTGPSGRGGGFGSRSGGLTGPSGPLVSLRKRNLDAFSDEHQPSSDREKSRRLGETTSLLAFENSGTGTSNSGPATKADYFQQHSDDDDDEESRGAKEQPKPTVQLNYLPSTFTKEDIKSLFRETNPKMVIDSIRIIPAVPQGPSASTSQQVTAGSMPVRKCGTAIVTLHTETPSSEIDALTSTLQNRYLGYGFRLSIHRQLASAALSVDQPFPTLLSTINTNSNHLNPFGAKAANPRVGHSHSRAPPPSSYHRGGYPPPTSYSSRSNPNSANLQVVVTQPSNLRYLKLIHKTVEQIFTHGPEFEALLMNDEFVQKDERWSFLFDTRGEPHAYYRWRLWEVLTGYSMRSYGSRGRYNSTKGVEMFEGSNQPFWIPPRRNLKYEWVGTLEDIVDDPDYRSDGDYDSESDSDRDDDRGRYDSTGPTTGLGDGKGTEKNYLGPLKRAKLIWLIARIPTVTTKVRRGDISRVMAFAIENAAAAEEVVEVLIGNVIKPLGFQKQVLGQADENEHLNKNNRKEESEDKDPINNAMTSNNSIDNKKEDAISDVDTSGARVIGLWLISDVLSNSSLGIRHAWRYRSVMEQKIRESKMMEVLGKVYHNKEWGRIRREKFRRLVTAVLGLWENWCIFPQASHEEFMRAFMEAPHTVGAGSVGGGSGSNTVTSSKAGTPDVVGRSSKSVSTISGAVESQNVTSKSRWKTVDTSAEQQQKTYMEPTSSGNSGLESKEDVYMTGAEGTADAGEVGRADDDIDGVPFEEDDIDGVPMEGEDDIDGVPMEDEGEDVDEVPVRDPPDAYRDEKTQGESQSKENRQKQGEEDEERPKPKIGFGMSFGIGLKAAGIGTAGGSGKRKRPKAEDMFAEDDDDGDDDE